MAIDMKHAYAHCESWIEAWNQRDLEKVLSHYTEEFIFVSPKIKVIYPVNKECTIHKKSELREYFSKALVMFPKMRMEILSMVYEEKTQTAVLDYWNHLTPEYSVRVMELMVFSNEGLIENVLVGYGIERGKLNK